MAQGGAVGSAAVTSDSNQSFDFEEELPDQVSATQRARRSRELTNKVLDDALKHMKSREYGSSEDIVKALLRDHCQTSDVTAAALELNKELLDAEAG